LVVRQGKDDM